MEITIDVSKMLINNYSDFCYSPIKMRFIPINEERRMGNEALVSPAHGHIGEAFYWNVFIPYKILSNSTPGRILHSIHQRIFTRIRGHLSTNPIWLAMSPRSLLICKCQINKFSTPVVCPCFSSRGMLRI